MFLNCVSMPKGSIMLNQECMIKMATTQRPWENVCYLDLGQHIFTGCKYKWVVDNKTNLICRELQDLDGWEPPKSRKYGYRTFRKSRNQKKNNIKFLWLWAPLCLLVRKVVFPLQHWRAVPWWRYAPEAALHALLAHSRPLQQEEQVRSPVEHIRHWWHAGEPIFHSYLLHNFFV